MGTHNLIRDKNRDQVPIKMKVFATFVASTFAQNGIETNSWPANRDAPHCGCQILIDTEKTSNQYVNKTCSLSFDYPLSYSNDNVDPHFVSVASSFMVGRDRSGASSQFKFTGYDEVSNAAQLDILVFYEQNDCYRAGVQVPESWDEVEQSTIWEYYNMTTQQSADLCNFELTCTDTCAVEGVHLGNFNYDIARSVQTYTVPIYGLEKGESATFDIRDYNDEANNCMNDKAHEGHGTTTGCSTNSTTGCSNILTFDHDKDHNGLLEYFQFEPVSPTNNPTCFALPIHHIDDYQWQTPSPWDTQQAYADSQS